MPLHTSEPALGSVLNTATRWPAVEPVALTLTANNQTKAYGAALPTLTVSYSGFVDGDTSVNLTTQPTLTTTATASSHVGTHAITASGAGSRPARLRIQWADVTSLVILYQRMRSAPAWPSLRMTTSGTAVVWSRNASASSI